MDYLAHIALGSNLGDRDAFLKQALNALRAHEGVEVVSVSSFHETEPVGGPSGQGRYLNAAAALRTRLLPDELLHRLLEIEAQFGRVRSEPNAPRTLDLDLLLFGGLICSTQELTLPHPRLHERLFVLGPLVEIAAEVFHPLLGRTIQELREALGSEIVPNEKGRRAVVTGSTSGIGQAMVLALAEAGFDVAVHGRRSLKSAMEVANEANKKGVQSQVILADLRSLEECDRLVHRVEETWPDTDVWINNAGADTLTGEARQWSFERKFEELTAVDVKATLRLSRAMGWRMKERGHGVIINMGWDQAETGMEGDSGELFAAIKGAVMAFSRSLALSLAPEVRVNCLAPGWIKTAWGETASADWQRRAIAEAPLSRWGTPEDVAAAAVWLASPTAAFVTGQIVRVNGGAVR